VIALGLRQLLIIRNKKRDEAAAAEGAGELDLGEESNTEFFEDRTDFENQRFRYSY
jgi:hypothetical protein